MSFPISFPTLWTMQKLIRLLSLYGKFQLLYSKLVKLFGSFFLSLRLSNFRRHFEYLQFINIHIVASFFCDHIQACLQLSFSHLLIGFDADVCFLNSSVCNNEK